MTATVTAAVTSTVTVAVTVDSVSARPAVAEGKAESELDLDDVGESQLDAE